MAEHDTQKTILEYLALRGIFHYRNNSGGMLKEYKGKKYFLRFGAAGIPDIICVIKGRYVGLEVKALKTKQNHNQKEFQAALTTAGAEFLRAQRQSSPELNNPAYHREDRGYPRYNPSPST